MDNGKREFEELRDILQKLDRSLDEAQHKRQHGSTPPARNGHIPADVVPQPAPGTDEQIGQPASNGTGRPSSGFGGQPASAPPSVPARPAVMPDHEPAESQPGRLKAKPLRRSRPENTGPAHGWVH